MGAYRSIILAVGITLGRQDVYLSKSEYFRVLLEKGLVDQKSDGEIRFRGEVADRISKLVEQDEIMSMKPDWREAGAISDKLFFTGLGFDDIKSVDASSSEGADYICDLNYTDMHSKIGKKFDLIIDGGTIEHEFHIPNCMKNIFDLLNVGGHIIHISPSNDRIDHGFYQFSPLLFHQYYVTNKFEIKQSLFMRCPSDNPNTTKPIQFGEYKPGSLDKFVTEGSVACSYATYFCVKKNEDSTANLMPHQYTYRNDAAQQAAEESPSG